MRRLGRPTPRDVLAGLVTGLFSIPEGIAYASIGGFNPAAGLYSGVVPGILASVFARTALMVTTLTSAIALSSRSVLAEKGLDPADPANVAALAVVVGAVMFVFGLLRFGSIMNFVSNAVMTGFSTGIALQIIAGVLNDATGYNRRAATRSASSWMRSPISAYGIRPPSPLRRGPSRYGRFSTSSSR
jgi:SulP family sulfate permease